jgi:hypothetical protein
MHITPERKQEYLDKGRQILAFCKSFYINDSVDGAHARGKLLQIELLEEMIDADTGVSYYHKQWQAALEEKKELLKDVEEGKFTIRQKIFAAIKNGMKIKGAFLKDGSYKFTVKDLSLVPREYLIFDEKKAKENLKKMDGMISIPGVSWERSEILNVRK